MPAFDLALAYPQWQGSGRSANLPRGAAATAAVCERFARRVDVPLSAEEGDGHRVNRWDAVFDQFRAAQALLARHAPRRLLTAGGDCAIDVAAIDYLNGLHDDLTVLWIDAHPDANTPQTSPSGNFHGMVVPTLLGHAPEPMRALMGAPLRPGQLRYHGTRASDEGDDAFRREHRLADLDPARPLSGPVHIHFDLDVLDPAEFPWLAYTDGALGIDEAIALVARVAREGELVGLTITEFAPTDEDGAHKGSKVIERICEAAAAGGRSMERD